jgi:hypothetical protein
MTMRQFAEQRGTVPKKLRRALLLTALLLPLTGFAGCPPTDQESCPGGCEGGGGESESSGSSSGGGY